MEILQTIWTALTTENETLTSITGIPFVLIDIYISMLLFTTLFNINYTKRQVYIYTIILSIATIISRFFIPTPFSSYINAFIMFILILCVFKVNIIKGFFCLISPYIIIALLESILAKFYSNVLNINYLDASKIAIHRTIISLLIYTLLFILYLLLKYYKVNFKKIEIMNSKKKFLLILNLLIGILLIGSQLFIAAFYTSQLPFFITLLNICSIIIYFIVSIYTILTVSKLETTSINLEQAEQHNKTLELLQDNTRAFRHDMTNILIGMGGYIDKNDMEGLKKYHSQLLDDIKQVNNLTTLSPKVVNNPGVYNVLANKYHKADNLGIKINLEVFLDLNDLHMKIYEFTRVLGILMDNAIEAASECEEKIINVSIRKDNRKHMQLLIIENTYKDKDIDTEKIYDKGFSTKEGNTGLGLWEVRQILKKNNNLNLFTSKNDKYFSQQFEIYY